MSAEKLELKDGDEAPCVKCGAVALDTGWECTECGFDNRDWYYPKHERGGENADRDPQ